MGQDELEITRTAHTTLVIAAPGLGDDIQAIKAGIFECADVFAVNKSDREGADSTVRDLELMLALGGEIVHAGSHSKHHAPGSLDLAQQIVEHRSDKWIPPIVRTVATKGQGIGELMQKLEGHRLWLMESEPGARRRQQRLAEAMRAQLRDSLIDAALSTLGAQIDAAVQAVERQEIDPYTASEKLVEQFRSRP